MRWEIHETEKRTGNFQQAKPCFLSPYNFDFAPASEKKLLVNLFLQNESHWRIISYHEFKRGVQFSLVENEFL